MYADYDIGWPALKSKIKRSKEYKNYSPAKRSYDLLNVENAWKNRINLQQSSMGDVKLGLFATLHLENK